MQPLLKTLSHLLELDRPRLTADDALVMTDDVRDALQTMKVLVAARAARSVVCDACHSDHVEEVVRTKCPGGEVTFHIRCAEAGWVLVPEERLRQWTIDLPRLLTMLSEGVGSGHSAEELIDKTAWRLGQVEIAGEQFAVVLVRERSDIDGAVLVRIAACTVPERTILVGAGDFPDATRFAALVSLASAFAWINGRTVIQLDHIRTAMTIDTQLQGNVFRLIGEFWQLSFNGQTVHMKDSVGLCYLARLLTEPQREIPAVTLLASRVGIDPRLASGSDGELLDEDGRATFQKQYEELTAQLAEAKKNNDIGNIEKLQTAMNDLANEISRRTGLGGRSRERTDADRVRKAVSMAVSRDIERIASKHEALGHHLQSTISSGLTFRYDPEQHIDWLT